jgi:hypothetical protein
MLENPKRFGRRRATICLQKSRMMFEAGFGRWRFVVWQTTD